MYAQPPDKPNLRLRFGSKTSQISPAKLPYFSTNMGVSRNDTTSPGRDDCLFTLTTLTIELCPFPGLNILASNRLF